MTAGMPMTPVDAIDVHTHVVPENFPRYSGVTADLPWPSMDAAHWGEKQHIQHAQFFRLRAAENRRAFIVAASSGVSQIITPNGVQRQKLPAMVEGVLDGAITPQTDFTFFTRFGWLTPWLSMAALTPWFAWLLWIPHGDIVTPSLK